MTSRCNDLIAMPDKLYGRYHNACTEPCDMIEGPCACGAWHHLMEWCPQVVRHILKSHPWAKKLVRRQTGDPRYTQDRVIEF